MTSDTAAPNMMLLETPYLIPNQTLIDVTNYLKENNVQLNIMTNSLSSTDAFYTVAALHQRVSSILKNGVQVSVYDGSPTSNLFTAEPISQTANWGTHAKRAVIGNTIMVGTFNIDPRSDMINAEMALICRDNKEAATYVRNSIEFREKHAVALDETGNPKDGRPFLFNTSITKKVFYWLSGPFAAVFGDLL
jgi:putative cardiolipin synthase